MKRELRIALLLLLIFVGGGFVGWLVARTSTPNRPPTRRPVTMTAEEILKEMDASLHLTPEQRERINVSLVEWRKKGRGLEANSLKLRHELFQQIVSTIRTNLTPGQQQQSYDGTIALIDRRFRQRIRNLNNGNP